MSAGSLLFDSLIIVELASWAGSWRRWPTTGVPQYLGDLVLLLGWTLLAASLEVLAACALLSLWFILAPRAEEPWLEEQYGDEYRRYRASAPRFL